MMQDTSMGAVSVAAEDGPSCENHGEPEWTNVMILQGNFGSSATLFPLSPIRFVTDKGWKSMTVIAVSSMQ